MSECREAFERGGRLELPCGGVLELINGELFMTTPDDEVFPVRIENAWNARPGVTVPVAAEHCAGVYDGCFGCPACDSAIKGGGDAEE